MRTNEFIVQSGKTERAVSLKEMSPFRSLVKYYSKAYIPLQRETACIGVFCWSRPPMRQFLVTYTNMLVYRNLYCPNPDLPNVSRWNRGCVGSPGIRSHVGHVDFMLFVSIFQKATEY